MEKIAQLIEKVAKTFAAKKMPNIFIKVKFEHPKQLHQIIFETLIPCFEDAYLGGNVKKNCFRKKLTKMLPIFGSLVPPTKIYLCLQKVAQMVKFRPIWSPC